jgi:hypothetical protein
VPASAVVVRSEDGGQTFCFQGSGAEGNKWTSSSTGFDAKWIGDRYDDIFNDIWGGSVTAFGHPDFDENAGSADGGDWFACDWELVDPEDGRAAADQ